MSFPTRLPDRSDQRSALPAWSDTAPHVAAPFAEAANDDDFHRNPLWLVGIALGCLFAILACLVASS